MDCIFCKIVKKDIPSESVYEDTDFFAFLDIRPVSLGHTLIIPKKHSVWMQETDDEIISSIFVVAKKLMNKIKTSLGCDYVQVSVVGKDVPHFHVHLIPRKFTDNTFTHEIIEYAPGEMSEIAKKIRE